MIYIQAWFACPLATYHDFWFMKKLFNYKSSDNDKSRDSLQKFKNHFWYLNPESAAMAFFNEIWKKKNGGKIENSRWKKWWGEYSKQSKRIEIKNIENFYDTDIDFLIFSQSIRFFERFEIRIDFLKLESIQITTEWRLSRVLAYY